MVPTSFWKPGSLPATAGKSFVYYEHVVAGVMQFDHSRVLHAREEALDCAFYLLGERVDVAILIITFSLTDDTNHTKGFF